MRISEMNWIQVEAYLQHDDRAVLPLGSTEQHAYLSLGTDAILAQRVAEEAAEPLGVPVFPVVSYGLTPSFMAYPGTVSISLRTYAAMIGEILESLHTSGFRRILLVNGHGGNTPAGTVATEWMASHPDAQVRIHHWWNAPRVWAAVQRTDPLASHASWMENFPWNRVHGVTPPQEQKPPVDVDRLRIMNPAGVRALLGDGNYAGLYERGDREMLQIWQEGVEETRALIEGGWR
ncbi:MAG: creatininase family protein [Thermaerobacter sp.]|nr:creatininase family protein [Thermaerobacter sp.]